MMRVIMGEMQRALRTVVVLIVAAVVGCASNPIPRPVSPAACGDQCAMMNCPPGTHCAFSSSCTVRCEVDPLPMH